MNEAMRSALGEAEYSSLRAFARVVEAAALAVALAERLVAAPAAPGSGGRIVEAEARLFGRLADCTQWVPVGPWLEAVCADWRDCLEAGSTPELALASCAALASAARAELLGGRAAIHRLELEVAEAVDALAWRAAAAMVAAAGERGAGARPGDDADDVLTGLPNHARLCHALDGWLACARNGASLGLVILSMEWGANIEHVPVPERERMRRSLTDCLRGLVRAGDLLAATGEHEWSLLLPALRSPVQLRLAAGKLIEACGKLLDGELRAFRGRMRAGGALAPASGRDAHAVQHAARTALAMARQNDSDYEDYRPEFAGALDSLMAFEHDLLEALHLQTLELHLQPQVRLGDGYCESVELLLRWQRAPGEWVSPPRIIEGAERLGVMSQLSRWLVMHGAHIAARLAEAAVPVRVNLNITAIDMRDEELPDLVAQALAAWRVDPGRFGLEITETALVGDHGQAARLIGRLRALGCPVALDDFGTGFSSLAYLRNLPVTELKIDQMFVRQLGDSPADQAIVAAIMRLADGFGLQVVAEGVEDPHARELLRAAGCDLIQGFLESAAMPLERFVEWWRMRANPPSAAPAGQ